MSSIKTFRDLQAWQEAMMLAVMCYDVTRGFPRSEEFGMTSQIRRAAASVPANIAEGHGRQTRADYARFLSVAHGSLRELETHLMLCERVSLTTSESTAPLLTQCDKVGKLLYSLMRALRAPAPST
ncbi:MAG: four helix bundle protein [Chloroflexi bacterium]|nr:four helix bundle protein [Chloroflexota bacterium]